MYLQLYVSSTCPFPQTTSHPAYLPFQKKTTKHYLLTLKFWIFVYIVEKYSLKQNLSRYYPLFIYCIFYMIPIFSSQNGFYKSPAHSINQPTCHSTFPTASSKQTHTHTHYIPPHLCLYLRPPAPLMPSKSKCTQLYSLTNKTNKKLMVIV